MVKQKQCQSFSDMWVRLPPVFCVQFLVSFHHFRSLVIRAHLLSFDHPPIICGHSSNIVMRSYRIIYCYLWSLWISIVIRGHLWQFDIDRAFLDTKSSNIRNQWRIQGRGVRGLQLPPPPYGLLRGKQKQAKTLYLVRCGQVATLPPIFNKILDPKQETFHHSWKGANSSR